VSDHTGQTTAEVDRRIVELSHAISLNPKHGKAYRDRALAYIEKRKFDYALSDLNEAVSINPRDAHAYYYRGHVFRVLKENAKAIADFDRAIEFDPLNAKLYQSHREKAVSDNSPDGKTAKNNSSTKSQNGSKERSQKGLAGFCKRLAQYYAEFLSTDFKKQRLPRRRLQNTDAKGRLIGIPLRKYPGFQQKLWDELAKPIGPGLSLTVQRGVWRSGLPKAVVEATAAHIAGVSQEDLNRVISDVMARVKSLAKQKRSDPDVAYEQFVEELRAALARIVISPLLDRMEGFFERTENKPLESLKELQDHFGASATSPTADRLKRIRDLARSPPLAATKAYDLREGTRPFR
jgi:tetratricopeptide (TPR) repeat protein